MSGRGKKSPIYEDSPPPPRRANIYEDDPPPSEEEIKAEAASKKAMADLGVTKVKLANVSGSTIEEVQKMAELSDFAYTDSDYKTPEIESTLKKQGYSFDHIKHPVTGMQCAIVTKNNDVYLSFRGTVTMGDVLKDLNATLTNSGFMSGRVHRGFYTGFKDLWPQISEKLDKHAIMKGERIEDFNFNFTGHSMGGALAKISALYVKKEWNIDSEKMKVVTFGDPRTFDIKQAREYDSLLGTRTLRVTQSGKDPVPSALLGAFGFKHVGARLKTQKPQDHSPHVLEGYKKGLKALSGNKFIDSKRVSAYYKVSQFFRVIIDFVPEKLRKALKNAKIALGKKSWHETLVKPMALEKKHSARTDTLTPDTAIAASKKQSHKKRGRS